ncbi:DUF3237 domain-containing protein [Nonomuraea sp. MCN248]|uniref:DUF3237 domain-containing protein n=1 Tax=Nonomuraea corallina TaxID=2989783 RepID=A0ABT4SKV3_9ACTN|nr:DUF3237 domain-containing protein [Nonomuraea corallina]MDA0637843.1 DUF3237 domain-containing protein [Nonomuraea corallina]
MTLLKADPADTVFPVEHLCDFAITFASMRTLTTPTATRLIASISHGSVEGPGLCGEFLAGGGDWITVGSDGVARMDVRALIRTHDGELVHLTSTGRVTLPDTAISRFTAGETIAWNEMHARSAPLFETGAERYAWLNSTVTVAVNELALDHVDYRVYRVG